MSAIRTSPDREAVQDSPTGATRHLCAGVYTNEKLRNLVLKQVCTSPHRRVAPSYGFDLVPVMRHAWWATHLSAATRLTAVAATATPLFLGSPWASLLLGGAGALLALLHLSATLLRDIARQERRTRPQMQREQRWRPFPVRSWAWRPEAKSLRTTGKWMTGISVVLLVVGLAQPEQGRAAALLLGSTAAMFMLAGAARQARINSIQRAVTLTPSRFSKREREVSEQQSHPCVVYRRPKHSDADKYEPSSSRMFDKESPFVGAGELIHEWNPMIIRLRRPRGSGKPLGEREYKDAPFDAHELVERLLTAVGDLNKDRTQTRLPVEVRDRVYMAETEVSQDRSYLSPEGIPAAEMRRIIDGDKARGLHFLEVSVPDYGSELVATALLHVRSQGNTLSLFFAACALTRTPEEFQRAEDYGQNGKRAVLSSAFRGLLGLPREAAECVRLALYPYFLLRALLPHDMTRTPIRNLGVATKISIREEHTQAWSTDQFDKTRILSHMKIVEQRLLDTTQDFLEERGVDISEFKKRADHIIQNSFFNIGPNARISNSAMGHGAHANNIGGGPHPHAPQNGEAEQ
ncbi:hypothetical protein Q8791_16310 [Nocardiopsis sp. CT-R113]|uniref:Uncharacterized protein n=1 Tax=Nocardiopsis codii TaxID=3065942 RepID=A0ABU7K975_9ACTN|nr:hypothetical protein [Nocardiopsis sp. CT-R113]MEE2038788.1 hypothetical protein [Nocardiopsis sp. CT-R113]